jgi:hypothetical protein
MVGYSEPSHKYAIVARAPRALPPRGRRRYVFLPQSLKDKSLREHNQANDNCQKDPPAQVNVMFKVSNAECHRRLSATIRSAKTSNSLPRILA